MGAAFSTGKLTETMAEYQDDTSLLVHVEEVQEKDLPRGIPLTSAIPKSGVGTAIVYRFNHLVVIVKSDGTSQLHDTRQSNLEGIESV